MEILRSYLIPVHGLIFSEHGIASSWEPCEGILLHPLVQFGAPCIKGTRVPARTIWGMINGGDSIELVAQSYGLEEKQIEEALEWERALRVS